MVKENEKIYDQLVEKAENFFQSEQFLEAFLIQSCLVEGVIKNCVFIHFRNIFHKDPKLSKSIDRWQISKLLELLLVTGIINRDLYKKIKKYTEQRNKVVHQILTYNVQERNAALKVAYQSGKEMKTFIVDELIRNKLDKDFKELQEKVDNALGSIAKQHGMTTEKFLKDYDINVRAKS